MRAVFSYMMEGTVPGSPIGGIGAPVRDENGLAVGSVAGIEWAGDELMVTVEIEPGFLLEAIGGDLRVSS